MATKTIKFNAGKVQYDEETKRCTPLPHKGLVVIKPSSEDPDFFSFNWSPKADTTVGGHAKSIRLISSLK
jgi:26S proteasome regulatory subunit N13